MQTTPLIERAYPKQTQHITYITNNSHDHAFLFCGPPQAGQRALAQYMAQLLLKVDTLPTAHPDIIVVDPIALEQSSIVLEQARNIKTHVLSTPAQAPYKVVLLHDAELLTNQASNALLKAIEEPAERSVIIMTSSQPDSLPKTVLSRIQRIQVNLLSHDEANAAYEPYMQSKEHREQIVHLTAGRFDMALEMMAREHEEEGSYVWWQGHITSWMEFLNGSVGDRTSFIETQFLKKKSAITLTELLRALNTLQLILHDALLLHYGVDGARTVRINQSALQLVVERHTQAQVKAQLSKIDELRTMAHANVNKKNILDYLITSI